MSGQSTATSPPTVLPSARQLEYADWELGFMMHFGIRTSYEGHVDWDGKPMDPAAFNPTQLDCRQWIAAAKSAGMKCIAVTNTHAAERLSEADRIVDSMEAISVETLEVLLQ